MKVCFEREIEKIKRTVDKIVIICIGRKCCYIYEGNSRIGENMNPNLLEITERKINIIKEYVWNYFGEWRRKYFSSKEKGVFYIGGSDVLPPPLKTEEEKYFIEALSGTDCEEAKKKLIAHNLRLVVYLARKFENTGVGVEDLISIGTIGLIKGIHTFNSEKNIKLATYASRCIENEILMHLRKTNKLKMEVSFDEPLNVDWDGNELLLSDILGTEEDVIYKDLETEVEIGLLHKAMEKLSKREREIIELRYGYNQKNDKEMTQKEVADLLGISQSYISRLEKKIMLRLRREIQKVE